MKISFPCLEKNEYDHDSRHKVTGLGGQYKVVMWCSVGIHYSHRHGRINIRLNFLHNIIYSMVNGKRQRKKYHRDKNLNTWRYIFSEQESHWS